MSYGIETRKRNWNASLHSNEPGPWEPLAITDRSPRPVPYIWALREDAEEAMRRLKKLDEDKRVVEMRP